MSLINASAYISRTDIENHSLPYNSKSFVCCNFIYSCKQCSLYAESHKLGFRVKDSGSLRVSRVRDRVTVKASSRVAWGQ